MRQSQCNSIGESLGVGSAVQYIILCMFSNLLRAVIQETFLLLLGGVECIQGRPIIDDPGR